MATIIPVSSLQEATSRLPEANLTVYNRVSSWGQAGKGKAQLEEKTNAILISVDEVAPDKLEHEPFFGVEKGYMSTPRKTLLEAVEYAANHNLILVASDLSRFIRSESYCRRTNREAFPTHEEFARLQEMTKGVVLATLADPTMTEAERQSKATKSTGKCGRPSKISPKDMQWIFQELGSRRDGKWDASLASLAKQFHMTKRQIQGVLEAQIPGRTERWVDLEWPTPSAAYRIVCKLGILPDDACRFSIGQTCRFR